MCFDRILIRIVGSPDQGAAAMRCWRFRFYRFRKQSVQTETAAERIRQCYYEEDRYGFETAHEKL